MLGHFHRVNREHTAVVKVQGHDLEHVARPVRPQVESTNRGLGVDVVAEDGVSDRVPDVGILDPVPSGTGIDAKFTHLNIVLQKYWPGKGASHNSGPTPSWTAVHRSLVRVIKRSHKKIIVAMQPDTCWSAKTFEWVAPGSNREPTD